MSQKKSYIAGVMTLEKILEAVVQGDDLLHRGEFLIKHIIPVGDRHPDEVIIGFINASGYLEADIVNIEDICPAV